MTLKVLIVAPYQTFMFKGGLRTQVERTVEELRKLDCEPIFWDGVSDVVAMKPDLIHIFSMNAPTFFQASALKKTGIPLVFSSVMWRSGSRQLLRNVTNIVERAPFFVLTDTLACKKLGQIADLILPNTVEEQKWISEVCAVDPDKCSVVPNGADNHFVGADLDAVDLSDLPEHFVFSLSVLSGRKNIARLVRAVNELDIPFVHAGKETDLGYLEMLKRIDRSKKCIFLGERRNDSLLIGALLKRNRVFALVSEYETPGIAALEAGLQDANCVVTQVGGPAEYFGEHARYVDPFSYADVRNTLYDAWEKGRQSVGFLPRLISEEYSWESVARKTLRAYEKVL